MCKEILYCEQSQLDRCMTEYRNAFRVCDPVFLKDPLNPNSRAYANCMVENAKSASLEGFLGFDDKCKAEEKIPYAYVSEASKPPDNPQVVEIFTRNSFDWEDIALYADSNTACENGAVKLKALLEKSRPVKVTINITRVDKFTGVTEQEGGSGEAAFSHIFYTPAYRIGKCSGAMSLEVLKSDFYYKKGDVINSEYSDDIYVAIQCHKQPMNKVCVK